VVIVCYGNIQRSVIAELCLNRELKKAGYADLIHCVSRGLQGSAGTALPQGENLYDYPEEFEASKPSLRMLEIYIPKTQKAAPIDSKMVRKASLILAMDEKVLRELPTALHTQFPDYRDKMFLYSDLAFGHSEIDDCAGVIDQNAHARMIEQINSIARLGKNGLLELLYRLS
jgi:protein-tyrosine-phosphatase